MDELKLFKIFMLFGCPSFLFIIIFLVLIVNQSASGDSSVIASTNFSIPFESTTKFYVSSPFGYRIDPLGRGTKFHDGIDLATPCTTNVVASADGIIYEKGFAPTGLGNYVYIKHQTDQGIIYSAYGHMLDNSIVVEKEQPILKGQLIGQVGTTGASTGCHLHFTLMNGKISFKPDDVIDPSFVINGLN